MLSVLDRSDLTTDQKIALWERQTRWIIVVAAVAPFISRLFVPGDTDLLNLVVDISSWAVFVVDFVVHLRIDRRYWSTGRGLFDLSILVLTFPWYVIPGAGSTAFMSVFRLARLARLLFAGETGRRFLAGLRRLGSLGIALAGTSLVAALIVLRHEPAEAGFEDMGDALWWSMVSFTTVGYGDLYPTTPAGRVAGGLMMFMGLMALGTVSGVLASVFSVQNEPSSGQGGADDADRSTEQDEVLTEVRRLREEVAGLRAALGPGDIRDAAPRAPGRPPGDHEGS